MYRILIADDEREEREGVAFLLDEFHYPLQKAFASNGKEALGYLSEHPVDILFTDVRMPIMDGLKLSEAARELYPSLKIIIYSGYSEFEYARTAIRIGVTSYILKPVNVDEFRKTLDQVMENLALGRQEEEKRQRQESYARKHLLLRTLYRTEGDSAGDAGTVTVPGTTADFTTSAVPEAATASRTGAASETTDDRSNAASEPTDDRSNAASETTDDRSNTASETTDDRSNAASEAATADGSGFGTEAATGAVPKSSKAALPSEVPESLTQDGGALIQAEYRRMLLLEFEDGFFEKQGECFEQEILSGVPQDTEYLNLNTCQSLLLFRSEPECGQHRGTEACLDLAHKLYQWLLQHCGGKCHIAVSERIEPPAPLSSVLRRLEELMEYRFFLPDTPVFHEGIRLDSLLEEETEDNHVLDSIKKDIAAKDFSSLNLHIDLLCGKYERNSSFSQMYVKFIFSSLYRDMVTELDTGDRASEPQLNLFIDSLYRSNDIRAIAALIKETARKLEDSWTNSSAGASREVDMIKSYIDGHYMEDLDLVSLAEKVYLSPRYLSTLFKRVTGCGINRYIKTVRMEKARELLETTNIKVVDLCEAVGFRNLSYFCQNFREFYGETPEKYRKADYYHAKSKE